MRFSCSSFKCGFNYHFYVVCLCGLCVCACMFEKKYGKCLMFHDLFAFWSFFLFYFSNMSSAFSYDIDELFSILYLSKISIKIFARHDNSFLRLFSRQKYFFSLFETFLFLYTIVFL